MHQTVEGETVQRLPGGREKLGRETILKWPVGNDCEDTKSIRTDFGDRPYKRLCDDSDEPTTSVTM
jgi:hypothetical protein